MKMGIRTPSLKKSFKARTTGRAKRAIKKAVIPGYGQKGMGWIHDPSKAAYNKVYNKTTVSFGELVGVGANTKTRAKEEKIVKKANHEFGLIRYYGLTDWWANKLTEVDRNLILESKSNIREEIYIQEKPGNRYNGENFIEVKDFEFLSDILINMYNEYTTAKKIALKIEELIFRDIEDDYVIALHFTLTNLMDFYYRNRDKDDSLDRAIFFGYKDIEFSNIFAKEFYSKYGEVMPVNKAYEQIGIILERKKKYTEAIRICEKGKSEGWSNDFDKRINRIKSKINKNKY